MMSSENSQECIPLNDAIVLENPRIPQRVRQIIKDATERWLKNQEIFDILSNIQEFLLPLSKQPPQKAIGGNIFLYDRRQTRYFRKDNHNWKKKSDGRSIRETHEKLKVGQQDRLNCYYCSSDESNLQRRSYWLLSPKDNCHHVLVHYLNCGNQRRSAAMNLQACLSATTDDGGYGDLQKRLKDAGMEPANMSHGDTIKHISRFLPNSQMADRQRISVTASRQTTMEQILNDTELFKLYDEVLDQYDSQQKQLDNVGDEYTVTRETVDGSGQDNDDKSNQQSSPYLIPKEELTISSLQGVQPANLRVTSSPLPTLAPPFQLDTAQLVDSQLSPFDTVTPQTQPLIPSIPGAPDAHPITPAALQSIMQMTAQPDPSALLHQATLGNALQEPSLQPAQTNFGGMQHIASLKAQANHIEKLQVELETKKLQHEIQVQQMHLQLQQQRVNYIQQSALAGGTNYKKRSADTALSSSTLPVVTTGVPNQAQLPEAQTQSILSQGLAHVQKRIQTENGVLPVLEHQAPGLA